MTIAIGGDTRSSAWYFVGSVEDFIKDYDKVNYRLKEAYESQQKWREKKARIEKYDFIKPDFVPLDCREVTGTILDFDGQYGILVQGEEPGWCYTEDEYHGKSEDYKRKKSFRAKWCIDENGYLRPKNPITPKGYQEVAELIARIKSKHYQSTYRCYLEAHDKDKKKLLENSLKAQEWDWHHGTMATLIGGSDADSILKKLRRSI